MPHRGVTITEPNHPVLVAEHLANAFADTTSGVERDTVGPHLRDALYPVEHADADGQPDPVHPDDPHDFPELTPEQHTNVADWYDRDAERSAYDADSISAHLRSDDPDGNGLRVYYAERATFHRERAAHHRAAAAR